MNYQNKVVWITGASSGIGEALVYAFNKAGAKLIISSRNRDALYKVKMACRKNGIDVHVMPLDLEQTDTLEEKTHDALRIFNRIDMVVHAGGVSQRSLAADTLLSVEQRIMNINYWGTVAISKALLPAMIANGGGHIVCISSLVGKFGTRFRSAYAASKHALHGYFDSLRIETADEHIDVTIICPGFIKTNVTLNALTADGSAQGSMDDAQANGMPADECAAHILKAINDKKEEVYIGGKEKKAIWIKRLFPAYFSKMIRKAKVT